MPAGETQVAFNVTVLADEEPELEIEHVVSLLPSSEQTRYADVVATEALTAVDVTIPANDYPHGLFEFETDVWYADETDDSPGAVTTVTIKRTRGTFGEVSLSWLIHGASLQLEPDRGVLTFAEGDSSKSFEIVAIDDNPGLRWWLG